MYYNFYLHEVAKICPIILQITTTFHSQKECCLSPPLLAVQCSTSGLCSKFTENIDATHEHLNTLVHSAASELYQPSFTNLMITKAGLTLKCPVFLPEPDGAVCSLAGHVPDNVWPNNKINICDLV